MNCLTQWYQRCCCPDNAWEDAEPYKRSFYNPQTRYRAITYTDRPEATEVARYHVKCMQVTVPLLAGLGFIGIGFAYGDYSSTPTITMFSIGGGLSAIAVGFCFRQAIGILCCRERNWWNLGPPSECSRYEAS
jgi:hypothetical protein